MGQRARSWGACLACVLAVWLAIATGVEAQSTGSSAGGSSWGSGSSSSSGSSSGSYSGGSSYSSTGSANSYEPPYWVQLVVAVAFLAFLFFLFRGLGRLAEGPKITVEVAQVAIDARSRRFVQEALAKAVAEGDTTSQEGLVRLLAAAARALTAARLAWIYAGAQHFAPAAQPQARATHTRAANDARARFQTELVRKADGTTRTQDTPDLVAREHEGEGVVVVSLVVATYAKLPPVDPSRVDQLEGLLADLAALPAKQLLALELIWSPSAEQDRMSTDELEALYPELTRLTAVGGRVFCRYCSGPHAAELTKCPHCGAPTDSSAAMGARPDATGA